MKIFTAITNIFLEKHLLRKAFSGYNHKDFKLFPAVPIQDENIVNTKINLWEEVFLRDLLSRVSFVQKVIDRFHSIIQYISHESKNVIRKVSTHIILWHRWKFHENITKITSLIRKADIVATRSLGKMFLFFWTNASIFWQLIWHDSF